MEDCYLVVKDSFVSNPLRVSLSDSKISIKEGVIFHSGMWPIAYVLIILFISVIGILGSDSSRWAERDWNSPSALTFIPLLLFFLWSILSYRRYGFLLTGSTLIFENNEKLFIYCGSDRDTYKELIEYIKKIQK